MTRTLLLCMFSSQLQSDSILYHQCLLLSSLDIVSTGSVTQYCSRNSKRPLLVYYQ